MLFKHEIITDLKDYGNCKPKRGRQAYQAKNENVAYEKELNVELAKLTKSRQKFMDMYTDDLISREELNEVDRFGNVDIFLHWLQDLDLGDSLAVEDDRSGNQSGERFLRETK